MIIVAHVLGELAPGPALGAVITVVSITDDIVAIVTTATNALIIVIPIVVISIEPTFFWKSCTKEGRGRVEIIKAIAIIDMLVNFAIFLLIFIPMSSFPTNAQWN